jgi:hypothetical protein
MVWVALAGPVTNLVLAAGCIVVLKIGLPSLRRERFIRLRRLDELSRARGTMAKMEC